MNRGIYLLLLAGLALCVTACGTTASHEAAPTTGARATANAIIGHKAQATANALISNARATATAIVQAAGRPAGLRITPSRATETAIPTATTARAIPLAARTVTRIPATAVQRLSPTPTVVSPTPTSLSSGPWQISFHRRQTVPASGQPGWTDVTFTFVAENTSQNLLDTDSLLASTKIQAIWQAYTYDGNVRLPSATYLPPGYRVVGTAQVRIPSAALSRTSFTLQTASDEISIPVERHYPPLPPLPTSRTDQMQLGQSFTVPGLLSMTPKKQLLLDATRIGDMSSNWALSTTWQNLGGNDASLGVTAQVMSADNVAAVAISSTTLAPAVRGTAVLHLPVLSSHAHYLLLVDPNTATYSVYRFTPQFRVETWLVQPRNPPNTYDLTTVTFSNALNGWVGDADGRIWHTADGGDTWTPQNNGYGQSRKGMAFANDRDGWSVGSGPIEHTTDATGTGLVWNNIESNSDLSLPWWSSASSVAAPDDTHVWVAGNGYIMASHDGGSAWTVQYQDPNFGRIQANLNYPGIAFPDVINGWVVGNAGAILHTGNGGASWITQQSGTTNDLTGVSFVNDNDGWIVGKGGTILHTTDGGSVWSAQKSDTGNDLLGVAFQDTNSGWAVGQAGTLLHTDDGGASWTALNSGTSNDLLALAFSDGTQGWAVGQGGTLLRLAFIGAHFIPSQYAASSGSHTGRRHGAIAKVLHVSVPLESLMSSSYITSYTTSVLHAGAPGHHRGRALTTGVQVKGYPGAYAEFKLAGAYSLLSGTLYSDDVQPTPGRLTVLDESNHSAVKTLAILSYRGGDQKPLRVNVHDVEDLVIKLSQNTTVDVVAQFRQSGT